MIEKNTFDGIRRKLSILRKKFDYFRNGKIIYLILRNMGICTKISAVYVEQQPSKSYFTLSLVKCPKFQATNNCISQDKALLEKILSPNMALNIPKYIQRTSSSAASIQALYQKGLGCFTFEGFKSSILDKKNGLQKLERGICTRHNKVTKL